MSVEPAPVGRLLKVEGAGNDFLLGTGVWAERLAAEPDLVRALCARHRGVGADGTLAVAAEGGDRVRLAYRNADGSEAAFCANGTRCAARAGVELLGLRSPLTVVTGWAAILAEVDGSSVTLELPRPGAPHRLELDTPRRSWVGWHLEVGVPHLVVPVEGELDELPMAALAPSLRAHPRLGEAGANVTFVERRAPGAVAVRSWERGVEGETLSCGSGVVAAAAVWLGQHGGTRLRCATLSGDELVVTVAPDGGPAHLTGPARFVAEVEPLELAARDAPREPQPPA